MINKTTIFIIFLTLSLLSISDNFAAQVLVNESKIVLDASTEPWTHKIPENIFRAVERCDAIEIVRQSANQIELTLPSGGGVYSKRQAEVILSRFFSRTGSCTCSIINEKTIGMSTNTIVSLKSRTSKYRLYILWQKEGGSDLIQQFRIEEQNDGF